MDGPPVPRLLCRKDGTGLTSRRWSLRYSQAPTGQPMSAYHHGSGSRLPAIGFCLGAVALLYGGSFYTRDWRPVVHQAGQSVTEQVSARSASVARPMAPDAKPAEPRSRLVELTARVEPEVTGAVSRAPESVASPPAPVTAPSGSEQAGASSGAPLPRVKAQAEAPRQAVNPARSRTQRAARRPRVQYARLRAERAPARQVARVQASRTAAVSHESASPLAQLFQFFAPGRVH